MLSFGNQELGAAATVQLLEDDAGNTVERVIPKAAFRRDMIVWDFDNESGDPDLDWLRSGLWTGLVSDLSQDLFVTPEWLLVPAEPRLYQPLTEAGVRSPIRRSPGPEADSSRGAWAWATFWQVSCRRGTEIRWSCPHVCTRLEMPARWRPVRTAV